MSHSAEGHGGPLRKAVEHASHLIPAQAPIRSFIHHNTLHAFEHLPFEEAVVEAGRTYGTQPYLPESAYAAHLATGRIRPSDLEAAVRELGLADGPTLPGGPGRIAYLLTRLRHPFPIPEDCSLDWALHEQGGLCRAHPCLPDEARGVLERHGEVPATLRRLWAALEAVPEPGPASEPGLRPRDLVLESYGVDIDEWWRPFLIRLSAAYLDQGIGYWPLPGREQGFLHAFRTLYRLPAGPPDPWLQGLRERLDRQVAAGWDAERTLAECLRELQVPEERWEAVIIQSSLALKGWAGMMFQFQERPDRAPSHAPPATLMDYLAVQMTLKAQAVAHVRATRTPIPEDRRSRPAPSRRLRYEAFVGAQLAGLSPASLEAPGAAEAWLRVHAELDGVLRRRCYHLAYERTYRIRVLDALLLHSETGLTPTPASPSFQAVFCIDEREESMRRHLEEVEPAVETFGYAGFFGVAMAFQGATDTRPAPLCPVVVTPKHLVKEVPVDPDEALSRPLAGRVAHELALGSGTLVRGGILANTLGLVMVLPLIGRTLFPRLAETLSRKLLGTRRDEVETRLLLERSPEAGATGADALHLGFSVPEMAAIVRNAVRTMGMHPRYSPIVMMIGHGSVSLNNPHRSAYDCGAAGGSQGGPNARAFAMMANHPEVRKVLAGQGIVIPGDCWFVGAFHNTADDSVTYFDVEAIPAPLRPSFEKAQEAMSKACELNAHERCRRFEAAPPDLHPSGALLHVQTRSGDLGEARPELGHATNAACIVGRREKTRGLFLDRRAFLVSYDPVPDSDGSILAGILKAVGPVGAGINLEYLFSTVDSPGYGCGTKLPHNVSGLIGVMDGHQSDLRTGLPWQMVEIHEPMRLLVVIEAEPERLLEICGKDPVLAQLVTKHWIQTIAWSPSTGKMQRFGRQGFEPYEPEGEQVPVVPNSVEHYRGRIGHLWPARLEKR